MKKSFVCRVIAIVSLFMILLFALQNGLQIASCRRHFYQSADILISQIEETLDRRVVLKELSLYYLVPFLAAALLSGGIVGYMVGSGVYYTITTPFLKKRF